MSSLWDKVLSECGHEHGHERSAKNLARRLGVKRPAVFSVLFSLRAASLVTSTTERGPQKRRVRERLMWRRVAEASSEDPAAAAAAACDAVEAV